MSQQKSKDSTLSSASAIAVGVGAAAAALETANANVGADQGRIPNIAESSGVVSNVVVPDPAGVIVSTQGDNPAVRPIDDLLEGNLTEANLDVLEQVALLDKDFQNLMPEAALLQALATPEILQVAQADVLLAPNTVNAATGAAEATVLAGAAGAESGFGALGTLAGGAGGLAGVAAVVRNKEKQDDTETSESDPV